MVLAERKGVLTRGTVTDQSSLVLAAQLLKELTGLDARIGGAGWVDLIQGPLADEPTRVRDGVRFVTVPYGCLLPEMVPVQGEWRDLFELLDGPDGDVVEVMARRLAS